MADGQNIITKHLREFCAGSLLGGVSSGSWLFLDAGSWTHLIGEWLVRFFFTSIIALASGWITAWSKDTYENYKAYRKQKQKEYERQKRKRDSNGRAA